MEDLRLAYKEKRTSRWLDRRKEDIGKKFNSLIVLEVDKNPDGQIDYLCKCDCGKIDRFYGSNVRRGSTKRCRACGEKRRRGWGHGGSGTPTYAAWHNIILRCAKDKNFKINNIKICERWKYYPNFLSDMGVRPDNHEINRKDNTQGFSPENCVWSHKGQLRRSQIGIRTKHMLHNKNYQAK